MAYTFDQIFAADPDDPAMVASGSKVLLFAPGDVEKKPLTLTDATGVPLANPVQVNEKGFGPAFMSDLDRVAWEAAGLTGFFTSYEGIRDVAVVAASSASTAAAEASTAASLAATAASSAAAEVGAALADARTAVESSAQAARDAANLVGAPADDALRALIEGGTSQTRAALNNAFVGKGQTGTVNHLYVAPNGSDTNDGLSAANPFRTFQRAFDYLATQGPILQGTWYVNAAAGTYPAGTAQQTLATRSVNRVIVRGPAVGGHPNVPTAVIDGAGGPAYAHGLAISGLGVRARFENLKFINFNSGAPGDTSRIGLLADHYADLHAVNVHANNCTWAGINTIGASDSLVTGGILSNSRNGFIAVQTRATVNGGTIIKGCTEAGAIWSRASHGHADDIVFEDNAVGLLVTENSNVDANRLSFKRNTYGMKTQIGGYIATGAAHNFNDGTADKQIMGNFLRLAQSGDFQELRWADDYKRVAYDRPTRTVTGTTEQTVLTTPYTLPANRISGYGNRLQVKVYGTFGPMTTGSVFTVALGDMNVNFTIPTAPAINGAFQAEVTVLEIAGGHWATGTLNIVGGYTVVAQASQAGFTKTAANAVTIKATLAATTNKVTIYGTDISIMG